MTGRNQHTIDEAPWRDEETLRELYKGRELTTPEIADELGCSQTTVCNWLEKFDMAVGRGGRQNYETQPWHDVDLLREMYVDDRMTSREIAEELNCWGSTIVEWLNRHDIETRPRGHDPYAPASYDITPAGYVRSRCTINREHKVVRLHRLLAVAEYGFEQVVGKVVHHKNGIPWDNRPDNIELLTSSEHARLHNLGEAIESE